MVLHERQPNAKTRSWGKRAPLTNRHQRSLPPRMCFGVGLPPFYNSFFSRRSLTSTLVEISRLPRTARGRVRDPQHAERRRERLRFAAKSARIWVQRRRGCGLRTCCLRTYVRRYASSMVSNSASTPTTIAVSGLTCGAERSGAVFFFSSAQNPRGQDGETR